MATAHPTSRSVASAARPAHVPQVVAMLNGQQMGGKRRSAYFYDLWCMKYLPKFKWDHLTGGWPRRGRAGCAPEGCMRATNRGMWSRQTVFRLACGAGLKSARFPMRRPYAASCSPAPTPRRGGQLPEGGARAAAGRGDFGCQARARLLPQVPAWLLGAVGPGEGALADKHCPAASCQGAFPHALHPASTKGLAERRERRAVAQAAALLCRLPGAAVAWTRPRRSLPCWSASESAAAAVARKKAGQRAARRSPAGSRGRGMQQRSMAAALRPGRPSKPSSGRIVMPASSSRHSRRRRSSSSKEGRKEAARCCVPMGSGGQKQTR